MADTKISALPQVSSLNGSELVPIVQGGATQAATAAQIASAVPNSGVAPGSYTNANITVNAKGQVTAASNGSGGGSGGITALTGDVTATGVGSVAATLANTAVTPGAYTNANITVDAKGRIISASNGTSSSGGITSITGDGTAGSNGVLTVTKINGQSPATVATTGSYNDLLNKPALGTAASLAAGSANGVATLGSDGKVPSAQLPATSNAVTSVAGKTGAVTLVPSDVSGLGALALLGAGTGLSISGGLLNASGSSLPARLKINGIGDSITARGSYHQFSSNYQNVPSWAANQTYASGNLVQNQGYLFYCTTPGTTASSGTGPTGITGTVSDGTVVWTPYLPYIGRDSTSFLYWAEKFSDGLLFFDQSEAYPNDLYLSLNRVKVISGGSGYSGATTITTTGGAILTPVISGGVITGVTVNNPGYTNSGSFPLTITDSGGGSGAVLSAVFNSSGTFGVSGCRTRDMVARLPDAIASNVDIFTVLGGTNDITLDVTTWATARSVYTTVTTNLKTIYEGLTAARKGVIPIPIMVRTGRSAYQLACQLAVNDWIRAYARKEYWANPLGVDVSLADPTGYMTDGAASYAPVGGTGGVTGAMTIDGLHPSPRGGQYTGLEVFRAAQKFFGQQPPFPARTYSYGDGYDYLYAPGGNILEGLPWVALNAYALNELCSSNGNVYRVTTAGTSASSGGPSGTTTSTDGTVTWTYVRAAKLSVLGSGTSGTLTNPGGSTSITMSGSLASGLTLSRTAGGSTTAGTVTCSIESPWSNGVSGQRQVIAFSLGSGGTGASAETWRVLIGNLSATAMGLQASDLGSNYYVLECEIEMSGMAMSYAPYINLFGQSSALNVYDGFGQFTAVATGSEQIQSSGEMAAIPNNGKLLLRTSPAILPPFLTNVNMALFLPYNTSGAANSATGTIKINYLGLRKVYTA